MARRVVAIAALGLMVAGCASLPELSTPTAVPTAEPSPTLATVPTAKPTPPELASTPEPTPTRLVIRYRRDESPTPAPAATRTARSRSADSMQVKAILPLKYVQFYADSAILTEKAKQDIRQQVLPVLLAEPGTFLRIEGRAAKPPHATDEACLKLSIERANAVAEYLISLGVPAERLFPRGVGAEKALFRDSTVEEELAQDRIIEFAIVIPMG